MTTATDELTARALPGATDHGDGHVTFAIYAPRKKSIHVTGNFNNWGRESLEQRDEGFWVTVRELPRGKSEYQFIIDDSIIICDPYAQEINPVANGPHFARRTSRFNTSMLSSGLSSIAAGAGVLYRPPVSGCVSQLGVHHHARILEPQATQRLRGDRGPVRERQPHPLRAVHERISHRRRPGLLWPPGGIAVARDGTAALDD